MKNTFVAGAMALGLSAAVFAVPAEAGCQDTGTCHHTKVKSTPKAKARTSKQPQAAQHRASRKAAQPRTSKRTAAVRKPARSQSLSHRSSRTSSAIAVPASGGTVVSIIESMAPTYGVPTWFALRVAQVESNYNPSARGRAGELGVFQLKCATAKGIGYRGSCSGLLNAHTGVRYGLIHLSMAMRSSGGDLRLAASKHNAGLGHKRLVPHYVAKVF